MDDNDSATPTTINPNNAGSLAKTMSAQEAPGDSATAVNNTPLQPIISGRRTVQGPATPVHQMGEKTVGENSRNASDPNSDWNQFISTTPPPNAQKSSGMSGRNNPQPLTYATEDRPAAYPQNLLTPTKPDTSSAAVPFAQKLGAANYPDKSSISTLGDTQGTQDIAGRNQSALASSTPPFQSPAGGMDRGDGPTDAQLKSAAFSDQAKAGGYTPISDNTATGVDKGMPITVKTQGALTDYLTPQGTMSFQGGALGVTGRQGGGTVSAPDQGNGGTIADNVAALDRQTAALKSRNDAYNGTGGDSLGGSLGATPAPVDIFARSGDSFGDSQMRAAQYDSLMQQASDQKGMSHGQRAALVQGAQGLLAPGVDAAQMQQQQQMAQNSLYGALRGHQLTADAAIAGHKLQADALRDSREYQADQTNDWRTNQSATQLQMERDKTAQLQVDATNPKNVAQAGDYQASAELKKQQGATVQEIRALSAELGKHAPDSPEAKSIQKRVDALKTGQSRLDAFGALIPPTNG